MKSLEHQIQSSFFNYIDYKYPYLRKSISIFAIPNGGARSLATGRMLKAEGVSKGVFDVFCAVPNKKFHGLWIEFKAKKNKLTEEQKEFMRYRISDGYECKVCYSLENAIECLKDYLNT